MEIMTKEVYKGEDKILDGISKDVVGTANSSWRRNSRSPH